MPPKKKTSTSSKLVKANKLSGSGPFFEIQGTIALNAILGGGFTFQQQVSVCGGENVGKTSGILASCTRDVINRYDKDVLWIASEPDSFPLGLFNDYEQSRVVTMGVDTGTVVMEEMIGAIDEFYADPDIHPGLIVVDSYSNLETENTFQAVPGAAMIASPAKMWSSISGKIASGRAKHATGMLITIQKRAIIGWHAPGTPNYDYPVPYKLGHNSSRKIVLSKGKPITGDEDKVIGQWVNVKVAKDRLFPSGATAMFPLINGRPDEAYEAMTLAIEKDIIHKSGSWFKLDSGETLQGTWPLYKFLQERRDILSVIVNDIKKGLGTGVGSFIAETDGTVADDETVGEFD